jgi:hypothetical protein
MAADPRTPMGQCGHTAKGALHEVIKVTLTCVELHQDRTLGTFELADDEGRTLALVVLPTGYGEHVA